VPSGFRVNEADHLFATLDRKACGIGYIDHVVHGIEDGFLRWAAESSGQIVVIVGDDEQCPTGRHRRRRDSQGGGAFGLWKLQVEDRYEIEPVRRGCPLLDG
jgi:hypothetical protein